MPKIIHCCWFGGPKTQLALKCRASWEKFAPGWQIREWTLDDLKSSNLPDFCAEAIRLKKWAVVSDWTRMRALYDVGGVYLDYDVELIRPFTPPEGEWVAGEWTASGETWMNPGSGIALEKDSAIARHMLDAYARIAYDPKREMMPWINEQMAKGSRGLEGFRVLEPEVLSAIDMRGKVHVTEKTLGIHHYALSWGGPKRKILQWLSWHGCRGLVDLGVKGLALLRHGCGGRKNLKGPEETVASFWEEHCCECSAPACYGACSMFERGWHERCVRVDGFEESVCGRGTVRFRRWGKLEMMYHGTMMSEKRAAWVERMNLRLRWLWRILGPRHRALRWRLTKRLGRAGMPTVWRIQMISERDEALCAAIAYEDGGEVFHQALSLKAGERRTVEMSVPELKDRALFRLFALNGGETGEIRILENTLSSPSNPLLKCIAWDLDGVVWDGTLSEGEDVKLRPGVMEAVKALDEVGVVSSICSKNDADVALAKLKELGIEEWFVFPQINWGPKSESLRNLAREMNIGLDAIAFVDDREENRAEVRSVLPQVRVFDETLQTLLPSVALMKEDPTLQALGRRRRTMYREEMARRGAAQAFAGDRAAFAAASGLSFELLPVEGERIGRCLELVQRTNQLNLTARRYDEGAFAGLLAENECVAVRVWDRYGDYGIVGFVAMKGSHLVECCFSCRAAGRGIERKVLSAVAKGGKLTADIVETKHNAPIREIIKEFL